MYALTTTAYVRHNFAHDTTGAPTHTFRTTDDASQMSNRVLVERVRVKELVTIMGLLLRVLDYGEADKTS